jgi:hypothetical protein
MTLRQTKTDSPEAGRELKQDLVDAGTKGRTRIVQGSRRIHT